MNPITSILQEINPMLIAGYPVKIGKRKVKNVHLEFQKMAQV